MLDDLKQLVYEANMQLPHYKLVTFTWGNVSGIDREKGLVVIKPSGVEYKNLTADSMVVVDLDGKVVEGKYNPSTDTNTHVELYKAFPNIGGVVHTHSTYATAWAQAGRTIPCYGTTHADYIFGHVPCARLLTAEEMEDYERNTGKVIIEAFSSIDYQSVPCVLCRNHGAFTWGKNPSEAVHNAVVLEECAKMALFTEQLSPHAAETPSYLLEKHHQRKHGKNAYYGQAGGKTN